MASMNYLNLAKQVLAESIKRGDTSPDWTEIKQPGLRATRTGSRLTLRPWSSRKS